MNFKFLLLTLFVTTFSHITFASQTQYKISSQFVNTKDFTACATLTLQKEIKLDEAKPNLSVGDKERIALVKELMKEQFASLSSDLRATAARVTISVTLPATLQLDASQFYLEDANGAQVGTFASDLLGLMDQNNQVILNGSGASSFAVDLTVAAFCNNGANEETTPSVEQIIQKLIK